MKKFEIFRYIKKWKYLIIVICILGTYLTYRYAMSKQLYTAHTVLKYANSEARAGMTPSGDKLDVTEIYSSNVITRVLEELSLNNGVDSIRSKCMVEAVIPQEEEHRKEALLEKGEDYVYHPVEYDVLFSVGSDYGGEYAANVLNSIINNYLAIYGEKYIDQTVLPNNASNIATGNYDYIECAEILDNSAREIRDYLYDKKFHYPNFRSAVTGYSFTDLYNIYSEIISYETAELCSDILDKKMSKNRDVLVRNYRNTISQYDIDLKNMEEKIGPLDSLITEYSSKSKAGIEYHYGKSGSSSNLATDEGDNNTDNYILKDVYEDYKNRINTETTYDELIHEYVGLHVAREYTLVDQAYEQRLLGIFSSGKDAANTDAEIREIEEKILSLTDKLDENYQLVSDTIDEFNQYLGAANISTLTSVNVYEQVNVKLYLVLAVVLFLICGCSGAVFIGRIEDIFEYIVYQDRKTKLPNRVKCDMLIDVYAQKPLPAKFVFILIRLDSLKEANQREGRAGGDTLLRDFGKILADTAVDFGFVGYNGSDQFMCLFESCDYKKAELFIMNLKTSIEYHSSQNPEENMAFSYVIEESEEKGIYSIRGLISEAFKEINGKKS